MRQSFLINKLLLLCMMLALVSACQSTNDEVPLDTTFGSSDLDQTDVQIDGVDENGLDASTFNDGSSGSVTAIGDDDESAQAMLDRTDTPLADRIIYFEFDSAKISDQSLAVLEAHGNFIASNGEVSVRLEGHSDERGSREYNIALGDRRAQSVRRVLLFQGASVDQIETVSYGEEQPALLGHTEEAWSRNRRVELVYRVN